MALKITRCMIDFVSHHLLRSIDKTFYLSIMYPMPLEIIKTLIFYFKLSTVFAVSISNTCYDDIMIEHSYSFSV